MTSAEKSDRPWLITGACGQLGRALLAVVPSFGVEVMGLKFTDLDITDPAAVGKQLDDLQPSVVINAAAYTAVDACETEPEAADQANRLGPEVLANACASRALLVHLSTEYVFPGTASRPIPEEATAEPLSEYGRSKWLGEQAVRGAGGDHLIVRSQWLFGEGANFVRTIVGAAAAGKRLRVVEDQLGRPTWTDALVRGLVAAIQADARGTLHLAAEGIASWFDFARAIVQEGARRGLNPEVPVEAISTQEMPRPAARPAFGVLGLARARSLGVGLPHWYPSLCEYLDREQENNHA